MEGSNELFYHGDNVRMRGQECIGEIVKIDAEHAVVAFKSVEINIPIKKLERAPPAIRDRPSVRSSKPITCILNLARGASSSFNPEIDLHGMSVNSALSTLDQWIDKALLLGYKQLKVIHGKGTGSLRNAVRTYLKSHAQVKRVIDRHPYVGRDGVTWLETV